MSGNEEPRTNQDEIDPRQLSSFLKYCSDDDRVIKGIFEDHKIRFTQPWALNDPLEFNPSIRFKNPKKYQWSRYDGIVFPSEEVWVRFNLVEPRINAFGILSLTKIWDSFDMWSRYANGHKGFLLALKSDFNKQPCMLSRVREPYPVREVDYVDEYAIDMEELVDDQGTLREELAHEQLFFRKLSRWRIEHEYRIVRPFSDLPDYTPGANRPHRDDRVHLFDFSLHCVEAVIFGACMSVENKRRIMRACEGTGIPFRQALIIRDEKERDRLGGKMGKITTASAGAFPKIRDICPFILVADATHLNDQQQISEIDSLSKLPYWEDASAWAQWYYEEKKRLLGKS